MPFGAVAAAVVTSVASSRQAAKGRRAAAAAAAGQSQAEFDAAQLRAEAFDTTLPILQQQLADTQQQFDPFIQSGVSALPELQQGFQAPQGASLGGIGDIVNQIMSGEEFSGLVDQRTQAVQGQLAAGGLTRSGTALREAANIPTDLAFNLENLLTNRQFTAEQQRISGLENLVGGGRAAAGAEAGFSGDIIANIVNSITGSANVAGNSLSRIAEAEASGLLGQAQIGAKNTQNLLNLGGTLGSAFLSQPRTPNPPPQNFGGPVTSQPSVFNNSGIAGFS